MTDKELVAELHALVVALTGGRPVLQVLPRITPDTGEVYFDIELHMELITCSDGTLITYGPPNVCGCKDLMAGISALIVQVQNIMVMKIARETVVLNKLKDKFGPKLVERSNELISAKTSG
jgi:hypothetical protein